MYFLHCHCHFLPQQNTLPLLYYIPYLRFLLQLQRALFLPLTSSRFIFLLTNLLIILPRLLVQLLLNLTVLWLNNLYTPDVFGKCLFRRQKHFPYICFYLYVEWCVEADNIPFSIVICSLVCLVLETLCPSYLKVDTYFFFFKGIFLH